MFDAPRGPKTQKDFPQRSWLVPSCANPVCPNYANSDVDYPKAGKYKGRQRYKCKLCKKSFFFLSKPPKERVQIKRASTTEGVEAKTEENLAANQPENQQQQRKRVSFLLTYEAAQGLQELCHSLGIDAGELLEQIGQGRIEVRPIHIKPMTLGPTFTEAIREMTSRDS